MKDHEIAQYLSRIKLTDCANDLAGLTTLQEQHMEHIPFENLDIVVGRTIALDHQHLYDKIVMKQRGGYCFELNTLYAQLLKSVGFNPKPVLGRVWLSNPKTLPPRNHFAHIIELEGSTYVTDIGFGGLVSSIPLDINTTSPVNDKDGMVRVIPISDHQFMIQRQTDKEWANLYSLENVPISEKDITMSNYYMSTNPDSHFYNHKIVAKSTEAGRITFFNNKMTIRKGTNIIDKKKIAFGDEWLQVIKKDFDLNLDFTEKEIKRLFKTLPNSNAPK